MQGIILNDPAKLVQRKVPLPALSVFSVFDNIASGVANATIPILR